MLKLSAKNNVRAVTAAILATATLAANPASAQSSVGTIGVALNVTNACVVNGAAQQQANVGSLGDINFADQPGIFGNVDGQLVGSLGTLQVLCSPGVAPQLTVGSGANDAAGKRRMMSNGNTVDYRLFSDSSRTSELGVGSKISLGTATTTPFTVPIYARVTSGGNVLAAGRYTDTVQVTLTW
jgi:spore coat protein U-like protein